MSGRLQSSLRSRLPSGYVCTGCRAKLFPSNTPNPRVQKRCITRNHIRRIQEAEEDWALRVDAIASGKKQSLLSLLEGRGYVNQIIGYVHSPVQCNTGTDVDSGRDELDHLITHKRVGIYCGVDPTAPSLHIGHMVPFMVLGWMYIHGYRSTFLVRYILFCMAGRLTITQLGGSTAHFGDPTGRLKSRAQIPAATRKANTAAMHMQLKALCVTMEKYADRRGFSREWAWRRDVTNNATWWSAKSTFVEVMKVMGAGMRLGPMLGRDT